MAKSKTKASEKEFQKDVSNATQPAAGDQLKQEEVVVTDPVIPVSQEPVEDVDSSKASETRRQYFTQTLDFEVKFASADEVKNVAASTQDMLTFSDSAAAMFYQSKDISERDKGFFPKGSAAVLGTLSFPKLPYIVQPYVGVPTYLTELGLTAPRMLPFEGNPSPIGGIPNMWRYPNMITTVGLMNVSGVTPGIKSNSLKYKRVYLDKHQKVQKEDAPRIFGQVIAEHVGSKSKVSKDLDSDLYQFGLPVLDNWESQSKSSQLVIASYYDMHKKYAVLGETFPQARVELFMESGSSLASTMSYLIDANTFVYILFSSIASAINTAVPIAQKNFRMDPAHAWIDRLSATQKSSLMANLNLILEASSKLPVNSLVVDTYRDFCQPQGDMKAPYDYDKPWVTPFVILGANFARKGFKDISLSDVSLKVTANAATNTFTVPSYLLPEYVVSILATALKNEFDLDKLDTRKAVSSPHELLECMYVSPVRISKFMFGVIADLVNYDSTIMRKLKQVLSLFETFTKTHKLLFDDTIFKFMPFGKVYLKAESSIPLSPYSGMVHCTLNAPGSVDDFWDSDVSIISQEKFEDSFARKRMKVAIRTDGTIINKPSFYQQFLITSKDVDPNKIKKSSTAGIDFSANLVGYFGFNDVISLFIQTENPLAHPIYNYAQVINDRLVFTKGKNQYLQYLPFALESYQFGKTDIYGLVSTRQGSFSSYFSANLEQSGAHITHNWGLFAPIDHGTLVHYYGRLGVRSVRSSSLGVELSLPYPYVIVDVLFDPQSQSNLPAALSMLATRF